MLYTNKLNAKCLELTRNFFKKIFENSSISINMGKINGISIKYDFSKNQINEYQKKYLKYKQKYINLINKKILK